MSLHHSLGDEADVVHGAGGQHDGEHVGRQVVVQEERVVDDEVRHVVAGEPGQNRLTQRAHLTPLGCGNRRRDGDVDKVWLYRC